MYKWCANCKENLERQKYFQAVMEGLTSTLKAPVSLGPRFAGSKDGFVNGTQPTFVCKIVNMTMQKRVVEPKRSGKRKWLIPNCPRYLVTQTTSTLSGFNARNALLPHTKPGSSVVRLTSNEN